MKFINVAFIGLIYSGMNLSGCSVREATLPPKGTPSRIGTASAKTTSDKQPLPAPEWHEERKKISDRFSASLNSAGAQVRYDQGQGDACEKFAEDSVARIAEFYKFTPSEQESARHDIVLDCWNILEEKMIGEGTYSVQVPSSKWEISQKEFTAQMASLAPDSDWQNDSFCHGLASDAVVKLTEEFRIGAAESREKVFILTDLCLDIGAAISGMFTRRKMTPFDVSESRAEFGEYILRNIPYYHALGFFGDVCSDYARSGVRGLHLRFKFTYQERAELWKAFVEDCKYASSEVAHSPRAEHYHKALTELVAKDKDALNVPGVCEHFAESKLSEFGRPDTARRARLMEQLSQICYDFRDSVPKNP